MNDDEAIQLDAYLDRLLAGRDAAPAAVEALPVVDPALTDTATRLRAELVRFHPSFRFEERLARRLRDAAEEQLPGALVVRDPLSQPVALPAGVGSLRLGAAPTSRPAGVSTDSSADGLTGAAPDVRHHGLLLGGAIASGVIASGVSLAGAGLVAWRRVRALHRLERLI
jgi:hypothetical protein